MRSVRSPLLLGALLVAACQIDEGLGGPFPCGADEDCAWGYVCDLQRDPPVCVAPGSLSGDGGGSNDYGGGDAVAEDAGGSSDLSDSSDLSGSSDLGGSSDAVVVDAGLSDTGSSDAASMETPFFSGEDAPQSIDLLYSPRNAR